MSELNGLSASQMALVMQVMSRIAQSHITIPIKFHDQVSSIKAMLVSDTSGLINTTLDYAINAAAVDMRITTDNANLTSAFQKWLNTINLKWLGQLPVGLDGVMREYYRERWKASSFLVLKTEWAEMDGFMLPVNMYFLDGGSVYCKSPSNDITLEREYVLKTSNGEVPLTNTATTKYYFQKPYSQWGVQYPTPFILGRGIYKNGKFLDIVANKGEALVCEALEYLLLLRKGDKDLAKTKDPNFIYNKEDFEAMKKEFLALQQEKKVTGDMPFYMTGFDTDIEHLIPDYNKALQASLFNPIESRILAGLGLIEIYSTSTRKEMVLNPKPFQREVDTAVKDFKSLLNNVLLEIMIVNEKRKKYTNVNTRIHNAPVKEFITDDFRNVLRNLYDRGCLSKKTFVELAADGNYENEVIQRKYEKSQGDEETMFPPVIQNFGPQGTDESSPTTTDDIPDDKTGIEKFNYTLAVYDDVSELPDTIKVLPDEAKKIWMDTFNSVYEQDKDEEKAIKIAWSAVKKVYKKNKDGEWVKKD